MDIRWNFWRHQSNPGNGTWWIQTNPKSTHRKNLVFLYCCFLFPCVDVDHMGVSGGACGSITGLSRGCSRPC
ncbi:hypothetical protein FQN60_013270 [Etheostoma spectabile]|uniref:Uncharacterized protein n=1 Tax=Etheostoma spectabile TaxID=54343 RepID=A0A5J5DB43_9PERO|nr:hypothetical protein FQN60_013270 [Etheostoma spectabile]